MIPKAETGKGNGVADLSERVADCERLIAELQDALASLRMVVGAIGTVARTVLPPDPGVVQVDQDALLVGPQVGVSADEVAEGGASVG